MARHEVRIGKILGASFLGLLFLLLFALVTTAIYPGFSLNASGAFVTFVLAAAYFFLCQWGLSHGNVKALREDWPLILALNGILLVIVILSVFEGGFLRSLLVLIPGLGGASAGAAVASRAARKRQASEYSQDPRET